MSDRRFDPLLRSPMLVFGSEQGSRRDMEDRGFYVACDLGYGKEAAASLRALFHQAAQKTVGHGSGSTGTVVYYQPGSELIVAHVGDSPAMLFVQEISRVLMGYDLIRPHTPVDPEESKHVRGAGGKVSQSGRHVLSDNGKVGLEMTRSFGDRDFPGVSKEPEINIFKLQDLIPDRARAYLCLASDGINGQPGPEDAPTHAKVTLEEGLLSVTGTYRRFMASAMEVPGCDNTSLFVLDVARCPVPCALGIFDGHGGGRTATEAARVIGDGLALRSDIYKSVPVRKFFFG